MVNGPSPGPAPAAHARASNSRLTRSSCRAWPHRKLRRKVPRVDGALITHPSTRGRPARPQRIGVVNAVAARQRRRHQGQHLVASVGSSGRIPQVNVAVHQFTQAQVVGQGDRQQQPRIGHQAVIIKGNVDAVGVRR